LDASGTLRGHQCRCKSLRKGALAFCGVFLFVNISTGFLMLWKRSAEFSTGEAAADLRAVAKTCREDLSPGSSTDDIALAGNRVAWPPARRGGQAGGGGWDAVVPT